jgi:hypothetical protein
MRCAALLALLCAAGAAQAADELGRLFFTPEQRAALDARRKARLPDKPAPVLAAPTTRVDGYVKRSNGPSTVWVNGEPAEEARIDERSGEGRVSVMLGEGAGRVTLKPGQAVDRDSGQVRDVIGDGEIGIRRRPSK